MTAEIKLKYWRMFESIKDEIAEYISWIETTNEDWFREYEKDVSEKTPSLHIRIIAESTREVVELYDWAIDFDSK